MAYHEHVERVKEYYLKDFPDDEKAGIAKKLLFPSDDVGEGELNQMWLNIYEARIEQGADLIDELWIYTIISFAHNAYNLPSISDKNNADRKDLIKDINDSTSKLFKIIKANGLDYHLFYSDTKTFDGFYFRESLQKNSQEWLDKLGTKQITISQILEGFAKEVKKDISEANPNAKKGATFKEIRFIKKMGASISKYKKKTRNKILRTMVMALYGGEPYEDKRINKLF